MLNKLKNKSTLASSALALAMAISPAYADGSVDKLAQEDNKSVVDQQQYSPASKKRKEILNDATIAIRETENALKELDEKNIKGALEALKRATGNLDVVLTRDPSLALAPISVSSSTYDVLASADVVEEIVEHAKEALNKGRLQEARVLIGNLASETVISVSNLPMASYPDAIKATIVLIDEGKLEEAKIVLQTALNSVVVINKVIPLPLAHADQLLFTASQLAEKAERSEDENKILIGLLKNVHTELKFAELLGYGNKDNFKNLYDQLDNIEDETKGGKVGIGLFSKIKDYLKNTVKSSQPTQPEK